MQGKKSTTELHPSLNVGILKSGENNIRKSLAFVCYKEQKSWSKRSQMVYSHGSLLLWLGCVPKDHVLESSHPPQWCWKVRRRRGGEALWVLPSWKGYVSIMESVHCGENGSVNKSRSGLSAGLLSHRLLLLLSAMGGHRMKGRADAGIGPWDVPASRTTSRIHVCS